ncbi:MAG: M28 family peptidase [candidate division Zixibacteria bacterium]|nr:M28 family peptidase [candidate division Zixibacteria bacterium]
MKTVVIVLTVLGLAITAGADELYKLTLHDHNEARQATSLGVAPLLQISDGYLILNGDATRKQLEESGLDLLLLRSSVTIDQLAIDDRRDRVNAERFPVLYEENQLRLLLIAGAEQALGVPRIDAYPIRRSIYSIQYSPPKIDLPARVAQVDGLETLINKISQDSLDSYLHRLEAFYRRLSGTDSNYAARDWIETKFLSFGYDSVWIDSFTGIQIGGGEVPCHNVIVYKEGSVYPDKQVVIGAHFDAVPECPGVDDNGSGTAGVLEIARVLYDYDLPMTVVLIAFDSEESGIIGSGYYVDQAVARGDDIVFMLNMDMIGHLPNDANANIYHGAETAYALLWDDLAQPLVGITGYLGGSIGSDHLPFQNAGFDVIFVQEYVFSNRYHLSSDSTTYINFDYMTRMVKASAATAYSVINVPPPVNMVSIGEPGDGQSQLVTWHPISTGPIDYYRVGYYPVISPSSVSLIDVPLSDTSVMVGGLVDGTKYAFFVQAFDDQGQTSYAFDELHGTPDVLPRAPYGFVALPLFDGVTLRWQQFNNELDFSHYTIIRDGLEIATTTDTEYDDYDPTLGDYLHDYLVVAVDDDGNWSDTTGVEPISARIASLEVGKYLAVNRSSIRGGIWVDEVETGVFMRQALEGFDYLYYSDSAVSAKPGLTLALNDMIDYELIILGDESGRGGVISEEPNMGGILDTLAYYMSIGGKVIVFGRFGEYNEPDTFDYLETPETYDNAFYDYFHIDYRVSTRTLLTHTDGFICDLVGAVSNMPGYPSLTWDSVATASHCDPLASYSGIPYASFVSLSTPGTEVLYTYDSGDDDPFSEGQPMAWRYIGSDYRYIFMDIPLSFMDRDNAISTLRRAVADVTNLETAIDDDANNDGLPHSFVLYQNYPNPFNPTTRISYYLQRTTDVRLTIYNILGQEVKLLVNGQQKVGQHELEWKGRNSSGRTVASGLYFYRLQTDDFEQTMKMLLLK